MQIGMVGLGRMGGNMARRLLRGGIGVVAFDESPAALKSISQEGAVGAASMQNLVQALTLPRAVWVMVPSGAPTDSVIENLAELLSPGDTILDGGNTFFKDDLRRAKYLGKKKIEYLDVGTSGGVWGLDRGYCLMIGGSENIFRQLEAIFKCLAPGRGGIAPTGDLTSNSTAAEGYMYCGPTGAGHFVKMVHNGIEYGLMQAYAEGFALLQGSCSQTEYPAGYDYNFDLPAIAELWRRGSVVGSWLLDLSAQALNLDPKLSSFSGTVADSGEGRWAAMTAIEQGVPAPSLTTALFSRFRSRLTQNFADKLLSAMRSQFGGHPEKK